MRTIMTRVVFKNRIGIGPMKHTFTTTGIGTSPLSVCSISW